MKGILAVTTGIFVLFVVTLAAIGITLQVALSILPTIGVGSLAMTIVVWASAPSLAASEFKSSVSPIYYLAPWKLDKNDAGLARFFISNTKSSEKQYSAFFTVFLCTWGFATSIMAVPLEVIRVLGLEDVIFPIEPTISTTSSPYTIEGFIISVFIGAVFFASMYIIPDRLLGSMGLRKIRKHNIVQAVPDRNLSKLSGLLGLSSFALFFFHGIFTNGNDSYVFMAYSLMYAMVVGVPISIMSLFYVYQMEPKIQQKLMQYLTKDFGIRVSSLEDALRRSSDRIPEKNRVVSCLGWDALS